MKLAVKASLLLLLFWLTAESHSWPSTIFNKNPKKNWAVLVAGSDGWYNYRHQADVCHAYQLLTGRGIPPENVITMMVDDIANNRRNPFRGQIFNDYKHHDVYNGTIIDYKGDEVDPHVLIRVLLGNETLKASGKKVLERLLATSNLTRSKGCKLDKDASWSGPEDNVFLYFTDHGSAGLIAFPNGELYARKLNETVTKMHASKRYSKFVMYVEACYSGSMFDGILSSKINAYALTAANPHQSSWACFCEDPVINTCLADEFSHNWMKDTETHSIYNRTLKQQYKSVRARTLKSQVQRYGDMKIGSETLDKFQAHGQIRTEPVDGDYGSEGVMPVGHVHLLTSAWEVLEAQTEDGYEFAKRRLFRLLKLGTLVKHTIDDIVLHATKTGKSHKKHVPKLQELKCFETVFEAFKLKCYTIQQVPEVAQYAVQLAKLCEQGYDANTVVDSVYEMCA